MASYLSIQRKQVASKRSLKGSCFISEPSTKRHSPNSYSDLQCRILEEIHEGECRAHIGGRSLATRALRTGYYCRTLRTDAIEMLKKCDKCQRFAPVHHQPSTALTTIHSPLPFATWGMDILGPVPKATGQHKFLLVAVDYFTKWVEAETVCVNY